MIRLPLKLRTAAIDSELDARDVGGITGGEECHCCGDLFGFAEALRRDLLKQGFAERLDIGAGNVEFSEQRRLDHAGTDGVHANVPADQFGGKRSSKVTRRRFRGRYR
jgi:hypothetical protein